MTPPFPSQEEQVSPDWRKMRWIGRDGSTELGNHDVFCGPDGRIIRLDGSALPMEQAQKAAYRIWKEGEKDGG